METVDHSRPIEVVDFVGRITPAEYIRHQDWHPKRYEIMVWGTKYTVGADDILIGPTECEAKLIDPGFRVRNRRSNG